MPLKEVTPPEAWPWSPPSAISTTADMLTSRWRSLDHRVAGDGLPVVLGAELGCALLRLEVESVAPVAALIGHKPIGVVQDAPLEGAARRRPLVGNPWQRGSMAAHEGEAVGVVGATARFSGR